MLPRPRRESASPISCSLTRAGPVARLASSQFPNRVWARQILTDIAGRLGPADVPILTDDFAG